MESYLATMNVHISPFSHLSVYLQVSAKKKTILQPSYLNITELNFDEFC